MNNYGKRPMSFDEYQELASRTEKADMGQIDSVTHMALGLAGEVGEVVELVKKWRFHGKPLPAAVMMDELSDVLWYLAGMARQFGLSFEGIAVHNIKKLEQRYPEGFVKGGGNRVPADDGSGT